MILFIWGALAMASFVAGLFFFHFWRATGDRLFVFLGLAFWALGASWTGLAVSQAVTAASETGYLHYLTRLVAFALIIIGIVDKNRRTRP